LIDDWWKRGQPSVHDDEQMDLIAHPMNFIEKIFQETALFIVIKIGVAAGFVK
jgi:hypothetical protein